MLDDVAQWELLFRGEDAFWRSAEALRAAGYDSVLSLTHDIVNDNRLVPMLTREQESRGTQHIRLLIPRGIQGVNENDRVTLQAWLELVDWTGMSVSPHTQTSRKTKLKIDPESLSAVSREMGNLPSCL